MGGCKGDLPIALLDSGVGGLTVLRALSSLLPNENVLYFADTAHLPYGNKGEKAVQRYCIENIRFLQTQPIKLIVIACNTACAWALSLLRQEFDLPIIGITEQGIAETIRLLPRHRLGILGTKGTIRSGIYQNGLQSKTTSIELFPVACPLFVPLVEEEYIDHPIAELVAREYLEPLLKHNLDGLLLGCTHYPFLRSAIKKVVGDSILIIDPSFACAQAVQDYLRKETLLNLSSTPGWHRFFVSEDPEPFRSLGKTLLQKPLEDVVLASPLHKSPIPFTMVP